jgi:signal transduction histidine kinase
MALASGGERLGVAELPANPRVTVRLLRALEGRRASAGEIASLVLCDPAVTLQLLLAAGAGPGVRNGALSIESCVADIGHEVLDVAAFRHATREFSERVSGSRNFGVGDLWRRALVCAESAADLARHCAQSPEAAYIAGLLHEIGNLALLTRRVTSTTINMTAEAAGAELVARCSAPAFLSEAVRLHRERPEALGDAPFLIRVVNVASRLCAEGATEAACRQGKDLLGLHERAVEQIYEDALEAARDNPGGVDFLAGSAPADEGVDSDLPGGQWQSSLPPSKASTDWDELRRGVGDLGLRAVMGRAMTAATTEEEALLRTRRLAGMLLGLDRHYFFLASAQDKALVGTPIERDSRQLEELRVALATSASLLAVAARERRSVHAFGSALKSGGAAVDRIVARMLGAEGLLCVPMSSANGVSGVIAFAIDSAWDDQHSEEGRILSALAGSAAEAVAGAMHERLQRDRARVELTAQFRALGKRVVHETGNPLSIVKNYLRVLADKAGDGGQFREELAILNEELDRIARIMQRMGEPLDTEFDGGVPVDLNALVREVITLCNDTLFGGRGIELSQQLDPHVPLLQGDAGALKQVVLNLLSNAAEAMPNGGRLTVVSADNVNLDGELFVLLQVTDSGGGIQPEILQRLFQPGTSTKGDGHEGIGLAVSDSIVRRMGGRILCRSSLGRGTIFVVLLPRKVARTSSPEPDTTGAASSHSMDPRFN